MEEEEEPMTDEQCDLPRRKPDELTTLRRRLESMFNVLKESAGVGDTHTFRLDAVNCADTALSNRSEVAAFTLRKLQALHYVAQPGVPTKNTVIVFLAADLNLALTEMAEAAKGREHIAAYDVLINGRNSINHASKAVASMNNAEVIHLI